MPKNKRECKIKPNESEQDFIKRKIRFLIEHEGKTQKQAVGQAYGMARQARKEKRRKKA